jgi:hypothetical protein
MEYLGINIIEHGSLATDEVWVIHKNDAPQIPAELRGRLSVPCVLTGDASRARQLLSFMSAIDSKYAGSRFVQRVHA